MHWRHTPWRELKGGMAAFLQGEGIRVELSLILKTTCTIFIKTTLNNRLWADINEMHASSLLPTASPKQSDGLPEPAFPTAPYNFKPCVSVRPHDLEKGLGKKKG